MDVSMQTPMTAAFGKAGVVAGTTTTTTVTTTVATAIKGKAYAGVAAAANGTTPTTDARTGAAFVAVPINKACVFVFCADSANALQCVQGEIVGYSDAGVFERAPQFPPIPDTLVPIAYELVKIISTGSAWTMGVSNQAAQTGITKVFVDVATLPDRPQTS